LQNKHITLLCQNNNILYAGTDQQELYMLDLNAELNSWQRLLAQQTITSFYVKDGILYAGAADGRIFATQSDDSGWVNVARIGENPMLHTDGVDVYAGTLAGFYKQ
jgi:hypothetical protein